MRAVLLASVLLALAPGALNAQCTPVSWDIPQFPLCAPAPAAREVGPCADAFCCCDCPNAAAERVWVRAESLLWWIRSAPTGGLRVTTDPTNGASPTAGGLGDPTTETLLGGSNIRTSVFAGARLRAGVYVGDGLAVEVGGFFLGSQSRTLSVQSDASGSVFLFRPFVNADTGNINAGSVVAFPGVFAGGVRVNSDSGLWGTNINLAGSVLRDGSIKLDWLAGFRYLNLRERLDIQDVSTDLVGGHTFGGTLTAPGDVYYLQDHFHTLNQFFGGQLGLRGETRLGPLVLAGNVLVGLGDTQQFVTVFGSSSLLPATGGSGTTLPGGVLALPSNSGTVKRNRFTVVPEVGVQLGYDLTSRLRLTVGYDLLYWSSVVRPGNQVPVVVSAAQLPTSPTFGAPHLAVPSPAANGSDFWAQGITIGLAFRY